MQPTSIQSVAAVLFALAILHTFSVKRFHVISRKFKAGSVAENCFQLLAEIEIVFGLWAGMLLMFYAWIDGPKASLNYLESRNFSEPIFVFAILSVCSTRPILDAASSLIAAVARLLPLKRSHAFFVTTLTLGPILGSFITEPAAMAVTALVLLEHFYRSGISTRLKYATLGLLFVNISIGGTLTPYAAPPILMVAGKWGWDLNFMLTHFGWKGVLSSLISVSIVAFYFRKELGAIRFENKSTNTKSPLWLKVAHLLFLAAIVASAHYPTLVVGIFLFFLGFFRVTIEHQMSIRLKEGLLVSFFLAGLVVLGGLQSWWLEPVLSKLAAFPLYLSAACLTAVTDNATLTYLGSLVPSLSEKSRYAIVAGAVVGGGLTVIANAPNPAGYNILQGAFGKDGIDPLGLFIAALPPTLIAGICFWIF